jgi:two-component system, NarL family, sensor histidine kinase DegS
MTPQDQWVLQKEKALAWIRVVFAVVAVAVIQLNPSRISKFSVLSEFSLGSFLLYSLVVLYLAGRKQFVATRIGLATTCLDLVWISLIVFSTGGTRTPFFTYYFFPVITASSRWGIRGSIAVALIGDALYGIARYTLAAEALEPPLGIDTFIVRSIYLLVLAYIFGFLSEFEKKQNQKLLALSKTAGEVATHEERRRIARELHDGLLQSLATHLLRLETCRKHFLESPRELDRELQSIEDNTRNSMKLIRRFLVGKVAQPFPPGMLLEYLKGDLRFLRDGLGMHVILETKPEDLSVPDAIEHDLYYVLREGLMNITRHSQASRADVALTQTETEIRGSVTDDGIGFDLTQTGNGNGLGLRSMKERITQAGGELDIESSPGKGAKISFVLPLVAKRGTA